MGTAKATHHGAEPARTAKDEVEAAAAAAAEAEAEAEAILSDAVRALTAALGGRFVCAYALGSLAHGGFSPLVSDIDLGLIVTDPIRPDDADQVGAVVDAQRQRGPALAERLSVFWGTPATLRGEAPGGRFPPLDRLDLVENGRLLAGVDARAGLPRPGAQELLVSGAEFALESLAGIDSGRTQATGRLGSIGQASADAVKELHDPERLLKRGVRPTTKLVLFPARFMFSAATGGVGTNDEAARWYADRHDAPAKRLVAAALGWRDRPPDDAARAAELMRRELIPLYLHYIDDHIARLGAAGRDDLAQRFGQWRARIAPAGTGPSPGER